MKKHGCSGIMKKSLAFLMALCFMLGVCATALAEPTASPDAAQTPAETPQETPADLPTQAPPESETEDPNRIIVIFDDGRIAAGVTVDGIPVGGLTRDEALAMLSPSEVPDVAVDADDPPAEEEEEEEEDPDASGELFDESQIELDQEEIVASLQLGHMYLNIDGYRQPEPLADFGVTLDMEGIVDEAMLIGRSGSISERRQAIDAAKAEGVASKLSFVYDEETVKAQTIKVADAIPRESVSYELKFDPSLAERFIIADGRSGFTPDNEGMQAAVLEALASGDVTNIVVPGQANGEPAEMLPEGTRENTVLIAKYTTKVDGSANRRHNVKQGASMINGQVIQPGEVFSVNDTLGPRDGSSGLWRKAGAIAMGISVSEYGGGICQVSSTLFNAVARADLEIVEWVHHSWPSSYVPIGCDATISTPGPDFRFQNNTDWPIYLVGVYDESTRRLTIEVWGRPLPDGITIDIKGERTATVGIPSSPRYVTDPRQVGPGRVGYRSKTTKLWYDAEGNLIKSEVIHTNYYRPQPNRVLKGTDPTPDPGDGGGGTDPVPDPGDGGGTIPPSPENPAPDPGDGGDPIPAPPVE